MRTTEMKFRKKPVVVEARRFTGQFDSDMIERWMGLPASSYTANGADRPMLAIPTRQGFLDVMPGDWIIQTGDGQFYPCKPDAFTASYDQVEDE